MVKSTFSSIHTTLGLLAITLATLLQGQEGARVEQPHVTSRMLADTNEVTPGQTFFLGIEYTMEEAWHIYWKNPGDTGIPTEIYWDLPEGFSAGPIQWPAPQTYLMGGLMNYVHEGTVVLMSEIQAPANLDSQSKLTFKARSDWLVCKDVCLPGGADLTLTLPVNLQGPSTETSEALNALFQSNQDAWPQDAASRGLDVIAYSEGNSIFLVFDSSIFDASTVYFFEDNTLNLDPSGYPSAPSVDSNADQILTQANNLVTIQLTKSEYGPESIERLGGVLQSDERNIAFTANLLTSRPEQLNNQAQAEKQAIGSLLVYAFLGGLILNLMPCVFPVIGIKIMGFVNQAGEAREKIIAHGLSFTLGVLVSFWILAGIFIAVRAGGESLGWGFQFENPATLYVLTIVFLILAMNMSGVFEFGTSAMSIGQGSAAKSGLIGTFFSGVLATVVSTPCSGPFLGTALGAVITLPALETWLIFTVIAIGLATPYLALSAFPKAIKLLPKPGAWMESFKLGMAFLLYGAAAVMLAFFAGTVSKNDALDSNTHLIASLALTLIAFGIWIYGRWAAPHRTQKSKWIGRGIAALLVFGATWLGYPRESQLTWESWSPERVLAAQSAGETVYVDFTASWCATCQTNKIFALGRKEVVERVIDQDIVLLKADWTDFDPQITEELARYQRNAVPFNLVYGPSLDDPMILPEVLTPSIILDAFDTAQ